jgi:hypothetical protein
MKGWVRMLVLLGMVSVFCIGCGGGGGGGGTTTIEETPTAHTLSGVAAAGAPIVGVAYLIDKNNKQAGPVTINASGNFSFTLDDTFAAPFVLKAEGHVGSVGYIFFSAATGFGTANINPITNLALANATGMNPETVYSNVSGNEAKITDASLQAAIASIKAKLQPLLDEYAVTTFDPITGTYVANHEKLDGMFDEIEINVEGTTVSIVNKLDNTTLATGTIENLPSIEGSTAAPVAIAQMLSALVTAFKGTATPAADLEPFFVGTTASPAAFGYNDGLDRSQTILSFYLSGLGGNADALGDLKEIKILSLQKINASEFTNAITKAAPVGISEIYQVKGAFCFKDGSIFEMGNLFVAKDTDTKWKIIGNQWLVQITFCADARIIINADDSSSMFSGLKINIKNNGSRDIHSARLIGPGLPSSGITYYSSGDPKFKLDDPNSTTFNDAAIDQMSEAADAYYLKLYQQASVPATGSANVQKIYLTLGKKPVKNSELTTAMFPSITMPGLNHTMSFAYANIIGKTPVFTYAKPSSYSPAWLELDVQFQSLFQNNWTNIPLNATTSTFSIACTNSASLTSGSISISSADEFGRNFNYKYVIQ